MKQKKSGLTIEIDCNAAVKPLKEFFLHIPDKEVIERVWELSESFFPKLIFNAISNLSKAILSPNIKHTDKTNPFIETSYPVNAKWPDIENEVNDKLNKISKEQPNVLAQIPLESKQEQILNLLNKNRISISNSEIEFDIPDEYLEYQKLINGNLPEILVETRTPISTIKFKGQFLSKKQEIEGIVFVMFTPLLVVKQTQEIRFPIFVGLKTLNNAHQNLTKRQEKTFWNTLLQSIAKAFSISTDEVDKLKIEQPLTEPKIPIIKSPMHLESLKHGRQPDPQMKMPFYEDGKPPIEVIGLNLEKKHHHALNAIQKILQETKYRGNVPGTELDGQNNFKFTGYLPRIRMSRAQYLDAYGVKKHESSRGKWEFSGKEVEEALSALKDLHTQNHLIISRRKRWENGKELIDRIQTISPIIRIYEGWEGLTKSEDDYLSENAESEKIKEKHKGFLVEPCPLMVDQINEYFLLKPANMYQEIKLKFPNASKYSYVFLDWIIHEAHLKKGKSHPKDWPEALEVSRESLANSLRLDCYVKSRNWKRIDQIIAKCIQIALGLGWICKHETAPGKTVTTLNKFFLNKEKFDTLHKSSVAIENS